MAQPKTKQYRVGGTSLKASFHVSGDGDDQRFSIVIKKRGRVLYEQALDLDVARFGSAILCVDADHEAIKICPMNPLSPDILLPVLDLPEELSRIVLEEWDLD